MRLALFGSIFLLATTIASAETSIPVCTSGGTLASYIALGAGGCTIEDKVFFNFSGNITGNVPLSTSSIFITPITTALNPGISVNPNMSVSNITGVGDFFQDLALHFSVRTLDSGARIEDVSLGLAGGAVGTGATSINEFVCVGAAFANPLSGTGCPGGKELVNINVANPPPILFVDKTFASLTNFVDVFKDVAVHSGTLGNASISSFTQQFSEVPVPEPLNVILLGTALLAVAPILRRRLR